MLNISGTSWFSLCTASTVNNPFLNGTSNNPLNLIESQIL
jgi:hypothetical protein